MNGTRAILVLAALVSLPGFAEEPAPSATPAATSAAPAVKTEAKKAATKAAPKPAAGSANMIITKDAETGELRPATPAEAARLRGPQPLVYEEPIVEVLPDGTRRVTLDDRHAHWVAVRRNTDGTLTETCTVAGPPSSPAPVPAAK
jgi:hypothetical protein